MTAKPFEIIDEKDYLLFKITRPEKLNALTSDVLDGLTHCIDTLENQSGNRGLIVTGEGERAFCAGTDLFERQGLSDEQVKAKSNRARDLIVRLHRAPFVSIAALNGLAYGGGLELALGCTFRIAVPEVNCALPEVKLGLIPAYAGTQLLPQVVGPSRALDMMLTGNPINADEAKQIGLINRLAKNNDTLVEEAIEYLVSITQFSKVAVNAIRQCAAVAGAVLTDEGLQLEKDRVVSVGNSEDAAEGVAAFREKRQAVFKHK